MIAGMTVLMSVRILAMPASNTDYCIDTITRRFVLLIVLRRLPC